MNDVPRRVRWDRMCPAERAVLDATKAVEAMGCDARLTVAVVLLAEARTKIADYVDAVKGVAKMALVTDPDKLDTTIGPDGMQKQYLILSDEERAKGFVRPVRDTYIHEICGKTTAMSPELAETYARRPSFYSATFCSTCKSHCPVGAKGEFVWLDGSKVGT